MSQGFWNCFSKLVKGQKILIGEMKSLKNEVADLKSEIIELKSGVSSLKDSVNNTISLVVSHTDQISKYQ